MGPISEHMSEANIIDGKAIAEKFRNKIADDVRQLKNIHNLTPGLAVVLVAHPLAVIQIVSMRSREA